MKLFGESEAIGAEQTSQLEIGLAQTRLNLGAVKSVIAFASSKGGVGKSAILTSVAIALVLRGRKVGLLDADLNSPSVAAMLGMGRARLYPTGDQIDPAAGPLGLRVVASNLLAESEPPALSLVDEEPPAITNGARPVELTRPQMIRRLLGQTRFGALDFLLIDAAPGLAEMELIAANAPLAGFILLSHPSQLGVQSAKCALETAARAAVPVLGIIENMTGFFCESCHSVRPLLPHGEMAALAARKGPPIIGRLPFDPRLAEACDRGTPFVKEHADAPLAKLIVEVAGRIEELLRARLDQSASSG
jgi:ATP-binding protein involved in chromosome partitioning